MSDISKVKILDLRPTQFSLGMLEVETKIEKFKKMKDYEIDDYLKDHPVPRIDYKNEKFMIDHTHLARVAWEINRDEIYSDCIKDLSSLSRPQFWIEMKNNDWVHPFDQFGEGPRNEEFLPLNIKYLSNDPYRSLAWSLKEEGGYSKTDHPFSEFEWANFLRRKIDIRTVLHNFDKALEMARDLSKTPMAKSLPGFIPKIKDLENA